MSEERRAPVQGDEGWHLPAHRQAPGTMRPGTIAWAEHEEAWRDYNRRYHGQSAERIAERGGFGYGELVDHLGHPPRTWEPR